MNLIALPAFTDNYIWLLHDGSEAIVVDPGEAAPVVRALDEHGLKLGAIVVTHHHDDHVGGVDALRDRLVPQGVVWGPAGGRIPQPYTPLEDGDAVELFSTSFSVIFVPGHTRDHIAFFGQPAGEAPLLFCGDTLFSGGCGRLFEGTPAQMHESLSKLAALPGETRVCCGHEYTLSNLKFAHAVEPDNTAVIDYTRRCQALRERDLPTLPSTIAVEQQVNPFLRVEEEQVQASVRTRNSGARDAVSVLAALREWKNEYQ
ncbi:MAG: hydroxyacylglutathione hydrolase [Methylibium sp.]|uniref:hydroxyacylglutathione hydrolase n=1 Tax=Methylibium sp. TaxID=2067992 RepID=UPI0017A8A860|nr:hydroxyacylglutathione hydrolase [Methylibium sp.]MBA3596199.1 hydroxyacylglutathione hydrolase [Methylibium sp.]